jgi:hypothetical protein
MGQMSADGKAPEGITYERVMGLVGK